jgi:hypothetical protein
MRIQADKLHPIQGSILDLYKALHDEDISVCVKERIYAMNYAEIVVSCASEGRQFDMTGFSSETKSRKEAMMKAELNALCMVAGFVGITIDFDDIPEQPKKMITWSNKTVLSYKQKGVDVLLQDMEDSGVDIAPINVHRAQMPEGSRLTVNEVARVFFPTGSGVSVVAEKPADPIGEQKDDLKLSRTQQERDNFIEELNKLNSFGWSEAKFKESQYKPSFKSLMDFAKFASDDLINHAVRHAV